MSRSSNTTREHILLTATEMFLERGYADTYTKEIAAEANISEALLFKYFFSKEKLYIEVFKSYISAHADESMRYFDPDQPLEWLYQFAMDLFSPDEHTPKVALMFGQVIRLQVKHFILWAIEMGEFHPILTAIFKKGQDMDQITRCDTADGLAFVYFRFLVGLIIDDLFFPNQQPVEYIKTIKRLFGNVCTQKGINPGISIND